MSAHFDLSALATAEPYRVLAQLRDEDPVHWSRELKAWILTRYDDVKRALMDEETYSVGRMEPFFRSLPPAKGAQVKTLARYIPLWLVFRGPPDHPRLRTIMNAPFAAKALASLRPNLLKLVDELIDDFGSKGRADLILDFALLLPGYVILDLLGAPRSDLRQLTDWSNELQLFLGQAQNTPDRYQRAEEGTRRMAEYFADVVEEKRRRPGEDMISAMIAGADDGGMTPDEIVSSCVLMLFGGQETTANLIGNGFAALMRNPEQLEQLRNRPELAKGAVDESLRYDGPVGAIVRVVATDHEIDGKALKAGDRVFAMINAGNRDPAQFVDPDTYDITRTPNRHLTFGQGRHFCLGAPLAKVEAEVALTRLAVRLERPRIASDTLNWRDGLNMRGVTALPIAFGQA